MKPQHIIFSLVIIATISTYAYPSLKKAFDNPVAQEATAFDNRTVSEIYKDFFGTEENSDTPEISAELMHKLKNGAWLNTPETDRGSNWKVLANKASSKKQHAASISRKSVSISKNSFTSKQSKQYRNQTKRDRTRSKTTSTASSRIRQSIRSRQLSTAKNKRLRDRSRGVGSSAQKRTVLNKTRRFHSTRSGVTPGS